MTMMDDQSIRDWLQYVQLTGLKRHDRRLLLGRYGDASAVLANAPWGGSATKIKFPDASRVEQQLAAIHQHRIQLIVWGDAHYPKSLAELSDAPLVLFVQGEASLLLRPQIAMVGSRSASPGGLRTAQDFGQGLSNSGITVTSGLALGVDGASHNGALKGVASTVAVVATGLDQVYPRRHIGLAERIREQGVMVTEFAPLSAPRRESFPQRNRIISGLSLGVLVVEAGTRSGSLITARLAGEQGREIFAIPGSIHLPTSRGCHQLIRQGAKLVETISDVLVEVKSAIQLSPITDSIEQEPNLIKLEKKEETVLALVDFAPTQLETLIEQSQLPIDQISSILLQLELKGCIAPCAGGQYQKISAGT